MAFAPGGPSIPSVVASQLASSDATGLADRMRQRTAPLHARAERSGIVADLLKSRASRRGYALLLRNLLPVYEALERGLERHRESPGVRLIAQFELYRAPAIAKDLTILAGDCWQVDCPILPEWEDYAARVESAASDAGAGLIGHAYVRYLGDLNGGRILAARLARILGPGSTALAFHEFASIADLATFTAAYRTAIDRAGREMRDPAAALAEAEGAFRLNIALSEAVGALARA